MKITIMESGEYHDQPDTIKVYLTEKQAIENIPAGYERIASSMEYDDEALERWLTIATHEVEGECAKGGDHEWGIDGMHQNEFCKKCYITKP